MAEFGPEEFQLKDGRKVTLRHCSSDDAEMFPEFQKKVAEESTNTLQVADKTPPIDKVRENWMLLGLKSIEVYGACVCYRKAILGTGVSGRSVTSYSELLLRLV